MPNIFGAFRTDTTLTTAQAQFGGVGTSFQISAYNTITITDGVDPNTIEGDGVTNETPDDITQTYLGNAIAWDYNYEVTDGTNTYTIGVFDYDSSGNNAFGGGAEQGFFIGFIGDVPPLNTVLTITALGDGAFANPVVNLPISDFVPCFVGGTNVRLRHGQKAVEDLKAGDQVEVFHPTGEGLGFATLVRVFRRRISISELAVNPKLRPVRISAGALGQGLPQRDLMVSRQHRMLVSSKIVERMFGISEVLVPAVNLTTLPGVFVDQDAQSVEYFHLLFGQHEVVYAEGAPSESLYTGPEVLKAISAEARTEILSIFPEIAELEYAPKTAFPIPSGKLQKQLIARHIKNEKSLLSGHTAP
ncbi:Hint domain-containing protein [Ruegeria halocynthiae]|uniref:Hint domain-containing protein n=1 Tax=Ruegeria halocynthiae TaxID=985054 RepID=A0A1H3FUZ8_9RHOB|nr:Hint domain-containing protein [Ruegeria halocynthiae]SDX94781.1 Hint domain-containing protein [Ruegeria halocynthiae]